MRLPSNDSRLWTIGSVLLVLAVALVLRYSTNILDEGPVFDEHFSLGTMQTLLLSGWSVETAIDFKETKGPAYIWAYAAAGMFVGSELNALRLVSNLFFVLGVVP